MSHTVRIWSGLAATGFSEPAIERDAEAVERDYHCFATLDVFPDGPPSVEDHRRWVDQVAYDSLLYELSELEIKLHVIRQELTEFQAWGVPAST